MKWLEVRVVFEAAVPERAEDLIAEMFYALGLSGVLIEDPRQGPSEGWGPGAKPPAHHAVVAYLPRDKRLHRRQESLDKRLKRLADDNIAHCRVFI